MRETVTLDDTPLAYIRLCDNGYDELAEVVSAALKESRRIEKYQLLAVFGMLSYLAEYLAGDVGIYDSIERIEFALVGKDYLCKCLPVQRIIRVEYTASEEVGNLVEAFASGLNDISRNAVSVCLWEEMNRLLIEFAERKTLSDFMQECRNQMSGEWDLYII